MVWKGFTAFPAHLRVRPVSRGNSRLATWVVPLAKRPRFPGLLSIRTRCPDTSLKATLWMKAQHEGALTPPCTARKNPQIPHTARQVACHPLNNSRGKRSSIPHPKKRPDSPVPTLQGPCNRSQKWRGSLRFLPPLEMRPSSVAPNPVESREAPSNSTVSMTSQRHPEKLPEVAGRSRGNPGFPAKPEKDLEKDLESPSSTRLEALFQYHDS